MKKKIALILILCTMTMMLCGCSATSYEEADKNKLSDFGTGYFTTIKEWWGGLDFPLERIVYANDTKVMYYVFLKGHAGGITPLYNADGTLQIYEGN